MEFIVQTTSGNQTDLPTATPHSVSEKENKVQRRMFVPKPLQVVKTRPNEQLLR